MKALLRTGGRRLTIHWGSLVHCRGAAPGHGRLLSQPAAASRPGFLLELEVELAGIR